MITNMAREVDKQIGARIKQARELEGLTQPELAKKIGYESGTAISLIEGGERSIQASVLEKIANVLHQDVQYLLSGEPSASSVNVKVALRADKNLNKDDIQKVENFIEFLKSQQNDGRGN